MIVLYGQQACDQFEPMVRYFQKALSTSAWARICFVCAAPNPAPLSGADMPAGLVRCHAHITEDRRVTLDRQTVERVIHPMCVGGSIYLHFICDDFGAGAFDNASVPQLIADLQEYFERQRHLQMFTFLFMHLDDSDQARYRQWQFIEDLDRRFGGRHIYPYLITNLLSDGSLCEDRHVWRAIMCELLAILAQRQSHHDGYAYSLGYMDLNANDEELYALRWKELCALFAQRCGEPMAESAAWSMLMGAGIKPGVNLNDEYQVRQLVEGWLNDLVNRNVIRPTENVIHNFRRLAGIEQQELPDVERAVEKFFELNFSCAQDPGAVIGELLDRFLERLSRQPNAAEFPVFLLEKLEYILKTLPQSGGNAPLSLPQRKRLQTKKSYLLQCCELYEAYDQQRVINKMIGEYARALLDALPRIRDFIGRARQIESVLSDIQKAGTEQIPSAEKYPHYCTDIVKTIQANLSLLFEEAAIFDADGSPSSDAIHQVLTAANRTLHSKMGKGFNGTFIDAIRTEFAAPTKMREFLTNYLAGSQMMFNDPIETPTEPESLYFVDDNLGVTSWAGNNDRVYLQVDNDNVELLNRFTLKTSLAALASAAASPAGSLYFSSEDGQTVPLFETAAPALPTEFPARLPVQPAAAQQASLAPQADDNPHHIRLRVNGNSYFLVWDWEPGLQSVSVELNNRSSVIFSVNDYNFYGGYNVTTLLAHGRNEVRIRRVHDGSLYGACAFLGLQTEVRYRLANNELVVENIGPEMAKMVLRETVDNRHIDYPLLPIAPGHQQGTMVYNRLQLQGEARLLCDPSEAYPAYRAVVDWGL